ncbi:MAG: PepSY domain-containing protein [Rhodobiaceae bacterium]|nr:PepSY domain-containing protein [Rhodobiaceae bacterium]
MNRKMVLAGVLASTLGAAVATQAFAENSDGVDGAKDAAVLAAAKVTLADAIKAVEAKTGAKVASADIESMDGKPIYRVEIAGGTAKDDTFAVDTMTGAVTAMATEHDEDMDGDED